MATGNACRVRSLDREDLATVLEIERRSFSSPWSEAMFSLELARPSRVALVAESDGHTVGWSIATRYDRTWHLMKIAVSPEWRMGGIGGCLLAATISRVGSGTPVTLEVRAGNRAAIALYARFGFTVAGRRSGYYSDNGEDALVMWRGDPGLAGIPAEALGVPEAGR